jgi:hypothetical protein
MIGWSREWMRPGDAFTKLTVIEDDGVLYDITLREDVDCERIPFLRHLGTEEEFSKMKDGRAQIMFPFITFDEWSHGNMFCVTRR